MFAVVVCLLVSLSVCHKPVLFETTNRAGFGMEASYAYPTVCYKEICVSPEIRDWMKFRHGKSIALSTELVDG